MERVGDALGIAAQITVLIGAGYTGTVWLRRWMRAQVEQPIKSVEAKVDVLTARLDQHLQDRQ